MDAVGRGILREEMNWTRRFRVFTLCIRIEEETQKEKDYTEAAYKSDEKKNKKEFDDD